MIQPELPAIPVADRLVRQPSAVSEPAERTVVLRGKTAIRSYESVLNGFLPSCSDAESLASIATWMRDVEAQMGIPVVTLVYEAGQLSAALLAVELTLAGFRTRLSYSGNMTGHCGLFTRAEATAEDRERRTLTAADALVGSGEMLGLLLSVKEPAERRRADADEWLRSSRVVAKAARDVYDTFDLQGDFDGSLAGLGAHTRRNLRYYRRRADRELRAEFHPNLEGADLRDAVLDLRYAMPDELSAGVLKNRIAHVARTPEAFCMGVKAADGRWLSWVSGWRCGRYTYIDWQCNRDGLSRYSLSTVMRSHLIEQESRRAQRQIRFLGGTPHTMHYGFREESCKDWLFTADGLGGKAMDGSLRLLAWLRRQLKPAGRSESAVSTHRRAPRRHRVASLLVRMVGVILRAEEA